ncbi:hypothetical protein B0H11DRAFT_1904127 [Mycena galericulata]|nr:hypothetical protein B0H11DRAFT_1904127 [Mycena galericulata]
MQLRFFTAPGSRNGLEAKARLLHNISKRDSGQSERRLWSSSPACTSSILVSSVSQRGTRMEDDALLYADVHTVREAIGGVETGAFHSRGTRASAQTRNDYVVTAHLPATQNKSAVQAACVPPTRIRARTSVRLHALAGYVRYAAGFNTWIVLYIPRATPRQRQYTVRIFPPHLLPDVRRTRDPLPPRNRERTRILRFLSTSFHIQLENGETLLEGAAVRFGAAGAAGRGRRARRTCVPRGPGARDGRADRVPVPHRH